MSSSAPQEAPPRSQSQANSSRRSAMRLTLAAAILGWLSLCGAGSLTAARAQAGAAGTTTPPGATTYSTTRRVFNVGILLIDSTTATAASGAPASEIAKGPENPDPYVFYIGESRLDLKPQNWELANPLAPATVTDQIKTRWDARAGGNSGYQIGQKVTKDMAAYWEVSLSSTTLPDLLKYDLLFVTNHRVTNFLPADREKLRKLVDAGGIFWMEDCGNMRIGGGTATGAGSFFLSNIQFAGGAFGNFTTSGPKVNVPNHPLLNSPYQLSLQEIANLGDKNYGDYHMGNYAGGLTAGTQQPNPETLVNIVGNTATVDQNMQALPYIAAGYYGSGSILLTSGDSGCDINDYCGGMATSSGGNSGPFAGTNIQAAHTEDLKFLYNIVNWGSSNTAYRRNDRRSGASYETLSAPLLPSFNFVGLSRPADIVNSITAPLLVNGLMYVSGLDSNGATTVRCYDTHPFSDYDGDGNYDDGLLDVALGLPYDEIWRYPSTSSNNSPTNGSGGEQPSPPIFSSVNIPLGNSYVHRDLLFVTEPSGQLDIMYATPVNPNGQLTAATTFMAVAPDALSKTNYDTGATHGVAPAPVVYGDLVFQVEPDGLVRCINAGTGAIEWNSFDTSVGPSETIQPTGTPTLGFSQLNSTSTISTNSEDTTNDLMLYVPTVITPQSQTGSTSSYGQILAYWVGTRNEVQKQFSPSATGGSTGYMPLRVGGGQGAPSLVSATNPAAINIANGPDTTGNASPFATPIIRGVYSPTYNYAVTPPELLVSAQDNYTAGNVSADYSATLETNGSQYTGRVYVQQINPGATNVLPPGNGTNEQSSIIVAVDYDVSYLVPSSADIPASTMAQITAYDNNSALQKIGQIQNTNLSVTNYLAKQGSTNIGYTPLGIPGGGLDTLTFSPDDMLIFSADQQLQNSPTNQTTANPFITSLFAVHPQADQSSTMLKWRFGLHKSGDADGTVNGQLIADGAPIYNYMYFGNAASGALPVSGTLEANPENISRLEAIGPPITTPGGITYQLASGYSAPATEGTTPGADGLNPYGLGQGVMTVLMAFTTTPSITLTLPLPFDATAGATVSQVNALDPGTTISASGTTTTVPILLDGPRGRVTIQNFNAGGGQFSASQSFVVTVTPVNQTAQVSFVIRPTPINSSSTYANSAVSTDSGSYTPLQWYYVLKGAPLSPPTLVGDYIYLTMGTGATSLSNPGNAVIVALDANPQANDPTIRPGFGEPLVGVVSTYIDSNNKTQTPPANHIHWVQSLNNDTTTRAYAPLVGSQGTLAINSSKGTFAYQDEPTLIADGKRLLEVAPGSDATWALNASQLNLVVGGDLPIYGDGGTTGNVTISNGNASGATQIVTKALSHPSTARKLGSSDYLIADTGNNRVLRVDRSGKIIWKLDQLSNDYNILGGGDPITLSGPTDVQYYIAPTLKGGTVNASGVYTGGTISGYEVHYLIADPGNYRIVEVADYFDTKGNPVQTIPNGTATSAGKHEVVWTTRTQSQQGRSLRYTSLQRYLGVDPGATPQYAGYPYIVATVTNSSVGGIVTTGNGAGTDNTGSSLVSLHYAPYGTVLPVNPLNGGAQVGLELWAPPTTAGQAAITTDPVGDGTVLAAADDIRETINSNTNSTFGVSGQSTPTLGNELQFRIRRLQRTTSFTQLNLPNLTTTPPSIRTVYLLCDIGAVYAVEATTDTTTAANGGPLAVRNVLWKFTQADYDVMNYQRFANVTPTSLLTSFYGATTPLITPDMLPRFAPSSVQLLPNGDFLIANAYQGPNGLFQSGQFNGEVFQVTPKVTPGSFSANGYAAPQGSFSLFTPASSLQTAEGGIFDSFSSPLLSSLLLQDTATQLGQVTTAQGTFVQAMGAGNNTNLLEQPLFAIRP